MIGKIVSKLISTQKIKQFYKYQGSLTYPDC